MRDIPSGTPIYDGEIEIEALLGKHKGEKELVRMIFFMEEFDQKDPQFYQNCAIKARFLSKLKIHRYFPDDSIVNHYKLTIKEKRVTGHAM